MCLTTPIKSNCDVKGIIYLYSDVELCAETFLELRFELINSDIGPVKPISDNIFMAAALFINVECITPKKLTAERT